MKFTPERPAPVKAAQTDAPAQMAQEGKSMPPPGFQLEAKPAVQAAAPVQAKMAPDNEAEAAPLEGKVAQRQVPEGENAGMCVENASPAPAEWQDFAPLFNDEFKSVLHMFAPKACGVEGEGAESATPTPAKYVKPGEASGAAVSAEQLQALFTDTQRQKITDFIGNHVVPERLFNGDDVGHTTAQQRILMAAHILDVGTYQPGSFEQDVHARMCWHWVHITHHYAGATPAGGLNQGMMGMFDHNNDVVLGSGSLTSVFHGKGVKAKDLPAEYNAEERIGPLPADTAHKKANDEEEAKAKAGDPKAKSTIKMLKTMPFSDFDKIQPGDWIWYYNANGSGIGSHSVIFSRWSSDVQEEGGVKYRQAVCFSQGKPEWGGREHTANLGERFHKGDKQISPINYVTRVSENANPADTVDELLPKGAEKKEKALVTANEKYIGSVVEKKYQKPVDRLKLAALLQAKNQPLIDGLGDHLTDGQRALLEKANESTEIETLVRLHQRLRAISNNSAIVDRNQESTNEKKGTEYDDVYSKVEAQKAVINAEIAKLDATKTELTAKIAEDNAAKDLLDTMPEAKAKEKELKPITDRMRKIERAHPKKSDTFLTTDPEYIALKAQRDALTGEISKLKKIPKADLKEITRLKNEIAKLKGKVNSNGWARTAQEKKLDKAQKQLPFSLVHPGSWKGESKGGTTGKIQDVLSLGDFEKALGEGELAKPEIKKPKGKGKAKK